MYTILISLLLAFAAGIPADMAWGLGWGIGCGVFAYLASQLVIGLLLRRKVMGVQDKIQKIIGDAQVKINRQINLYQQRPSANVNSFRKNLEEMQNSAARQALSATEEFKRYYRWNFLLERQINAMRVQLLFQIKEYKKVDILLTKTMLRDLQTVSIKLVRLYRTDKDYSKFFNSKKRLFRGDELAFFASVYAWMKLKKGEADAAREALANASKKCGSNEVLQSNLDHLLNNRPKHYTMTGFGDVWYSLALEEPNAKPQRRRQMF
jgi:hypothetical protein